MPIVHHQAHSKTLFYVSGGLLAGLLGNAWFSYGFEVGLQVLGAIVLTVIVMSMGFAGYNTLHPRRKE